MLHHATQKDHIDIVEHLDIRDPALVATNCVTLISLSLRCKAMPYELHGRHRPGPDALPHLSLYIGAAPVTPVLLSSGLN